jgi:hypothetical protein
MRRSRGLASGLATLLVAAVGCGVGTTGDEQTYLNAIRTVVPEATEVSNETLVRMGIELCGAGGDDEIQRAIEILFDEVRRFGAAESDIVGSAMGAASGAFCPPPASAGPDTAADGPSAGAPVPSLPTRAELEAAIAQARDLLLASIEAGVPMMTIGGEPAQLEFVEASLTSGVLAIEVAAADDDPEPAVVAYELSLQLAPFESELADLGPLMAALIRGAPSLAMRVVVDAGEPEALTIDAPLIADLVGGDATFDEWLERVTRETP